MKFSKDDSIIQILTYFEKQFGKDCFQVEDHWTGDLCAVGLTDIAGKYLMYLSTYNKDHDTFYVEIEEKQNGLRSKVVFDHLTINQLEKIVRQYLLVKPT